MSLIPLSLKRLVDLSCRRTSSRRPTALVAGAGCARRANEYPRTSAVFRRQSGVGGERDRAKELRKLGYDVVNNKHRGSGLPVPYNKSASALFVDAQNTTLEHFPRIHQHIQAKVLPPLSLPSVKKIYGDSDPFAGSAWSESIREYGLTSPYKYGRVNVDSMMAMDVTECLLKHNHIQTYILVTGDGDYVPLVHKLREQGKIVVGYGPEEKMSSALAGACNYYFDSNDLVEAYGVIREKQACDYDKERKKEWKRRETSRKETQRNKEGREQPLDFVEAEEVAREKKHAYEKEWKSREEALEEKQRNKEERDHQFINRMDEDRWLKAGGTAAQEEGNQATGLAGTVSETIGNLFGSTSVEAKDAPPSSQELSSPSLSMNKEEDKPPPSFSSHAKSNPHLLLQPKGFLRIVYRLLRGKRLMGSSFSVQEAKQEDGTWFTATFTDPTTKERFASGLVVGDGGGGTDERRHRGRACLKPPLALAEAAVLDGRVHYAKKGHAQHAAAARAIDCYIFREGCAASDDADDDINFQLCLEEPYESTKEGRTQEINYDALVSERNLLLSSSENGQ